MTATKQTASGNALGAGAIAAAFDWWRDAGVDLDYTDDPRSWLGSAEPAVAEAHPVPIAVSRPAAPADPPRPRIGGDPQQWPATPEEFSRWWLAEPSLDGGSVEGRIAPRGTVGAPLMVLVDQPEAQDRDRLLSGPHGALLAAILRALNLGEHQVYVASALPRLMPMPDWAGLANDGLGQVVAHHVRLARPRRLLVFGSNVSSLLGHDPAKTTGFLPDFHHEGASIPVLVAPGLAALEARPRGKARLWQALLEWSEPDWMGTEQT
ncbi:MAG: hypothetical protein KGM49_04015 [Sphingomonadales bacterium]|nr:hypothetical protein [Sphingomonadales bacterium]